jgi:hypothetical protein
MFDTYYYHQSLRRLVVGFGTLFNNIYVSHENNGENATPTNFRVPITYTAHEKFIQRLLNPSSITDGTRIQNQLPRMSFQINSITPDPSRRRVRLAPTMHYTPSGNLCSSNGNLIENEQPVNVAFNLFIYTRHIDDLLQIIEQIVPFFTPDHIIKLELVPNIPVYNIPVVMVSNNITDKYDGDLSSRRINIASFNFLAKSYVFGPLTPFTGITGSSETITFE